MLCLLSVTKDVIEFHVFKFLDVYSIVALDCALINCSLREMFRNALKRRVIEPASAVGFNGCLLEWIGSVDLGQRQIKVHRSVSDAELVSNMPVVQKALALSLSGCTQLTKTSLVPLLSTYHTLVVADLSNVSSVTDEVVEALANNHHSLRLIVLAGCIHLTDRSVAVLTIRCPALQDWDLKGCTGLTRACLYSLTRLRFVLHNVNLCGCTGIVGGEFELIHVCTGPTTIYIGK